MYEALVEDLRQCATFRQWATVNSLSLYKRDLMRKAADAIEALQQDCRDLNAAISGILDNIADLSKPRWVSVAERLPEEYMEVLCYYEYFRYGDYNCMFRTIDRGYFGNGRWGGEAGQGDKNKVLAWMPLPEPPKEEAK